MPGEGLKSEFCGCLVGAAIGDGLGAWREGRGIAEIEEIEHLGEKLEQLTYTDDTHMTIGVAESLIESNGFDGEHMVQALMRNHEAEPWRGYGPGPPRIFRMIKNGESWHSAASKIYTGGSFGNGAAMRVAPIGLLYYCNPAKLREIAYKSSSITHSHELGKEGAALQAYAVALALNIAPGEEIDRDAFILKLQKFAQNQIYREKLASMRKLLDEQDRQQIVVALGNGIEASRSVPTAIYCFLKQPRSYKDCIIYAISLGGDTDTIASMAGAISGAYLGVNAIPPKWRLKLENRAYIEALAEGLCQITT